MRFLRSTLLLSAGLFATLAFSSTAKADTLTLLGTSSPAYPTYPGSDATDTGAGYLTSDFAGYGTGVGTHLDFSVSGGAVNTVSLYDRTTSGGNNDGYVGGTTDFTTSFELIFSNNADFSAPIASYTFNKPTPASPTDPSSFYYTSTFAPVTASYMEYVVLAANGGNPGVADIEVSGPAATPEPSSLMLLGTGVLGMAGLVRRRFSSK